MRELDYTGDPIAAKVLVRNIESYWRDNGYYSVRAWVEPVPGYQKAWQIRTNIKFQSFNQE